MSTRISIYDKQLLSLEATKPLQRIIEREKAKAVKKAKAEGKEALKAYKESATRRQQDIINKYNMRIAERKKTELRNKIKKTHHDLDQMLRNPTDNNYIPRDLISAALDTLEAIDIRNGKDNMTQSALDALYTEYNELKNNDDYDYSSEYDKGLSEEILELKMLMKCVLHAH